MAAAKKSDFFIFEGRNKKGEVVKGEIMAPSEAFVRTALRRKGIKPSKVKKKKKSLFGGKKKVKPKDIAVFSRQLATMMKAGVPLVQAFDLVGKGNENQGMQELILTIKNDIEAGNSVGDSLAKHPDHFNDLFVNLVMAGEKGGILDNLLDKLATYLEKTEAIKAKIKKAMIYPIAIIAAAFLVTSILMIFVIPQFAEMFSSMGSDLPLPTKIVITISNFFVDNWYIIFSIVGFGVWFFMRSLKKNVAFRHWFERLSLKFPIFGTIFEKSSIARFGRTLSTMTAAGVPIVEALDSVAGATGNVVYEEATKQMRRAVSSGISLTESMRATNAFPNMMVQMTQIGEESGQIDEMLSKVADMYEADVDNMVDGLSTLMEPVIIVFLGVVIGGLVVAMYLPIFKLGSAVGG